MKTHLVLNSRRLVFVFLIIVSLLISCSKDSGSKNDGNGEYYVKFKRDGSLKELPVSPKATFDSLSGIYSVNIGALAADGQQVMFLILFNNEQIAAGKTYTQDILIPGLPYANLDYADETGGDYVSSSTLLNPDARATVTITEMTDTYLKGTFSGKLLTADFSGIKYNITDGEFYVKRDN